MKIKDLPWFSRPDFKFSKKGVENLEDSDLMSILLWVEGDIDRDLDISNKVLKKYNLSRIEDAGFNELVNLVKGKKKAEHLDFVKARKLFCMIELAKRYNKLKNKGFKTSISSAKDVYDLLVDRFGSLKKEHFVCLYLDTKNNIIKEEVVSVGTLNSSLVHPREVFVSAIRERANSIILVHNHPSGSCSPSVEDEKITSIFRDSGDLLGIKLLDHVVISKREFYSFREKGLIFSKT
jgi:DNA repair protein RadC